jgi:uncharacterized protein YrrD
MIRATRLRGLPVVDLESAVKIGRVHELILDLGRRRVAAVVVRRGRSPFGGEADRTVPGTAVVSVGADALTIRGVGHAHERGVELASYPTLTSMVNRKVLSRRGTLLGSVADVLLDERTGTIAGYALDVRTGGRGLFGLARRGAAYWPDYVKAEADQVGRHIIVAPDRALVQGEKIAPPAAVDPHEDPTGWRIAPAAPATPPPELVPNERPRRSRRATTASPRPGATLSIAVNGSGTHPPSCSRAAAGESAAAAIRARPRGSIGRRPTSPWGRSSTIAKTLVLSVKTVEAHKAHISQKLRLKGGIALLKYAARHGLIELDGDEPVAELAPFV